MKQMMIQPILMLLAIKQRAGTLKKPALVGFVWIFGQSKDIEGCLNIQTKKK